MSVKKFLDPKNHFCFNRLFETDQYKKILIHFINDVLNLEGNFAIQEARFLEMVEDPYLDSQPQSAVNVICRDKQNKNYIVELRLVTHDTPKFEKQAQYCAAKAYCRYIDSEESYQDFKGVIFIAIADFIIFPEESHYYSLHELMDRKTYTPDLANFSSAFLELPKFKKEISQLEGILDKWMYFFKFAEKTEQKDVAKIVGKDHIIREAYEALNRFSMDKVELTAYENANHFSS